jgi:hypothetical protein
LATGIAAPHLDVSSAAEQIAVSKKMHFLLPVICSERKSCGMKKNRLGYNGCQKYVPIESAFVVLVS